MLKAFSKTLDEGNFTFVIGMKLFRAAYISVITPQFPYVVFSSHGCLSNILEANLQIFMG